MTRTLNGLEFKLGVSFAPPQSKTRPAWAPFPPEHADLYAQVQAAIAKAVQPPGCAAKDPGGIGVPPNYATTVLIMPRYGARIALCDLLRAMNHQARSITKWTHDCEVHFCIMCYVHASTHYDVIGWVGNKAIQAKAHLFADADLAGSPDSQLSSSQLLLAFRGTNSCFQTAGTINMVAVELAKRTASLTCRKFWEEFFEEMVGLELIKGRAIFGVCQTGRYPTKYGRTRVSVAWMYGEFLTPGIKHVHESTNRRTVTAEYGHRAQQSFAKHDSKKGCEEILALTTDPEIENETPHNWNEYTAAPSVQRRGGITTVTTTTETHDMRDDLNGSFDALPLHEEGGVFKRVLKPTLRMRRVGGSAPTADVSSPKMPTLLNFRVDVSHAPADADCPASVSTDVLADGTGRPIPGPAKNESRPLALNVLNRQGTQTSKNK